MLVPVVLFVVFFVIIWKLWWSGEVNPLDVLPGPPSLPLLGHVVTLMKIKPRDLFTTMVEFTKKYGDRYIFKVGKLRVLHIHNPADVEIVLSHSKNITKSLPYRFLEAWLGTGLLLSTGNKWHRRRKILTPTFHFNILKNFATVIEEKSRDFVERLKVLDGAEVDLLPAVSDFTLFTICDNVISERRKQRGDTKDFTAALEGEDLGSKKRLAMLDLLLEAEDKREIDVEGIREEVNTFMFEGYDTTAMALTFTLMLLADHEEVQERIYEECKTVFGDSDRPPCMADWAEMKYLDAVIKEVMRLYPSVPFLARSITEDFVMGDLLVKKGSEVAVHVYDIHRRADLYPEPTQFRPERFLSGETRHPYAYVPFSAGPRNCIGQKFALMEMKCIISEICRSFRLQPKIRGDRPDLVADLVLRPMTPVYVQFTPR